MTDQGHVRMKIKGVAQDWKTWLLSFKRKTCYVLYCSSAQHILWTGLALFFQTKQPGFSNPGQTPNLLSRGIVMLRK